MPPRTSRPTHRHGAPSGPWPFIDIDDELPNSDSSTRISEPPLSAGPCRHSSGSFQEICWCRYPQSLFPNWTPRQQKKGRIKKVIETLGKSALHYLDIMQDGAFMNAGMREVSMVNQDEHWAAIQSEKPPGVRTRVIFVENLTGPVLQMLGTRYNIEPFFFSSSIGWIPSRFQSNVVPHREDHITVTLIFIRPIKNSTSAPPSPASMHTTSRASRTAHTPPNLMIDTQSPLFLQSSDLILSTELLSLHVVRSPNFSTIISYHPTGVEHRATAAASMHARMHSVGSSVYWSRIFKEGKDPTFVVLSLLWYAVYAWDEAMEKLYAHICFLESRVLAKNNAYLTEELHLIRAHLLHYELLLRDFQSTILFVQDTPFPAVQSSELYSEEERLRSEEMMKRECESLLSELQRLETSRVGYEWRLKNVMDLGFSMVNIQDSRSMQRLTEAAVQDSSAIKQISYLTMAFLPPSFAAAIFGMNVTALNPQGSVTLGQYFALVAPLTLLSVWFVIALEIDIKEVRVHRKSRGNRAGVVSDTKGQSKPSQYAVRKAIKRDDGDKCNDDEVGSDDERVEVRYGYKHQNRVASDEETETVWELDGWARLCWPFILISMALNKRRRRQKRKTKTKSAGSDTKTR